MVTKRDRTDSCLLLGPVHTGYKVDFDTVNKVESGQSCRLSTLLLFCHHFVKSRLSPTRWTLSNQRRTTIFIPIYIVSTLSPVCTHWWKSRIWQLVMVNIVANVEHNQLGRLCQNLKVGDFCLLNVERPFDMVDFLEMSTVSNSTLSPVCAVP